MSETMDRATISKYELPEVGFWLHEHYLFDQYGQITEDVIVWSVEYDWHKIDKNIYVRDCRTYSEALIKFITQIQASYLREFDGLDKWFCKLLDIPTGVVNK